MTTPTNAETMPAMRNRLSGMASTMAIARLVPSGNAAKSIPSIAKNRPIAARKSDMHCYFDPGGLGGVEACGFGAAGVSAGITPDGSEKKRKKSESGLRTRRVSPCCMLFS